MQFFAGDASGKELPIRGVDSAALESVISFFYRGECLLTPTVVVPIYDVCMKLEVPGLSSGCEQYIKHSLNPYTCPLYLEASVQLLLEPTIKQCLEFAEARCEIGSANVSSCYQHFRLLADVLRLCS